MNMTLVSCAMFCVAEMGGEPEEADWVGKTPPEADEAELVAAARQWEALGGKRRDEFFLRAMDNTGPPIAGFGSIYRFIRWVINSP